MQIKAIHLVLSLLTFALWASVSACGGLSFISADDVCQGPYCSQTCSIDADCPVAASCVLGRCSSTDGTGGGGADDDDGSGGNTDDNSSTVGDDDDSDSDHDEGSGGAPDDGSIGDYDPIDVDVIPLQTSDLDLDGDGYCSCSPGAVVVFEDFFADELAECDTPSDPTECCSRHFCPLGDDCLEGNPFVYPGAPELCDGLDTNCDGTIDGDCDSDNFGNPGGCSCNTDASTCQPDCPCDTSPACTCACNTTSACDAGCLCDSDCNLPGPTTNYSGPDGTGAGGSGDIVQNPDSSLTLDSSNVRTDFAWPVNDVDGTVSRIDTITTDEVGRYPSVLRIGGEPKVPDWNSGCNRPSRSTVDMTGNAYIANRAHDNAGGCSGWSETGVDKRRGSITKIGLYTDEKCGPSAAPDFSDCPCADRNANGTIDSSRDINGDGQIRTDQSCAGPCSQDCTSNAQCGSNYCVQGKCSTAPREFFGSEDECLLWTTSLPTSDANPRAMAIDRDGYIWVGDWQRRRVYKFDVNGNFLDPDGAGPATATGGINISTEDVRPYGAVIDSQGTLWLLDRYDAGNILSINTATGEKTSGRIEGNPSRGYGLTVDRRNKVWIASYHDGASGGTVVRYDPQAAEANRWIAFSAGLSGNNWRGRGLTATPAGLALNGSSGLIWAAFHKSNDAWLVAFNDDTGSVERRVELSRSIANGGCGARVAIGVGIGAAGNIWIVNQNSNNACMYDPVTNTVSEVPIGSAPYTYSDFTGNILRTFTAEEGFYNLIVKGCEGGLQPDWKSVNWNASVPGESKIEVSVWSAAEANLLQGNPPYSGDVLYQVGATTPPASEISSGFYQHGNYLLVRFRFLRGEDGSVPTLYSVNVARNCISDGG